MFLGIKEWFFTRSSENVYMVLIMHIHVYIHKYVHTQSVNQQTANDLSLVVQTTFLIKLYISTILFLSAALYICRYKYTEGVYIYTYIYIRFLFTFQWPISVCWEIFEKRRLPQHEPSGCCGKPVHHARRRGRYI